MTAQRGNAGETRTAAKRLIYYEYHGKVVRRQTLPQDEERVEVIRAHMPPDVRTILDVGCGIGLVTTVLSRSYSVVGVDVSRDVHLGAAEPRVCGLATSLPFRSRSVDLVLATQIFEHLTDADLEAVSAELIRVSRRYVLVTTTFQENLQEASVRCPACGTIFNAYGHLRTFDEASLGASLPTCVVRRVHTYGAVRVYPSWLIRLNQRVLGFWHYELALVCTECGNRDFPPSGRRGFAHLSRLSNVISRLTGRVQRTRILGLFEIR